MRFITLKNVDNVIDIRNLGFVGGIEMSTQDGKNWEERLQCF